MGAAKYIDNEYQSPTRLGWQKLAKKRLKRARANLKAFGQKNTYIKLSLMKFEQCSPPWEWNSDIKWCKAMDANNGAYAKAWNTYKPTHPGKYEHLMINLIQIEKQKKLLKNQVDMLSKMAYQDNDAGAYAMLQAYLED
ncbi:MAG: hypothetical protein GY750_00020 [Lentisphaerae bacterium]|nr:hypothetical protein [Lentisphaerota bacterium]MCP4099805.1 hypothetical protein [Lentisphaerota bacterium]